MDKNMIIEAAFNLIVTNGLEEFSIAKLANELSCTKSSIYNYFKSKEELLNSVFMKKTLVLTEGIDLDSHPEDLIRQYAHNCVDNPKVFVFFHKYARSNFLNKEAMCQVNQEIDLARTVVKKYVGKYAEQSKVNPEIYEALIFGPIHGLMLRGNLASSFTSDDIDVLVDHILSTIRKEDNERNN